MAGQLDPTFIDHGTSALMREGGEYNKVGWYGLDDNLKVKLGPFATRQACQEACDEANATS